MGNEEAFGQARVCSCGDQGYYIVGHPSVFGVVSYNADFVQIVQ